MKKIAAFIYLPLVLAVTAFSCQKDELQKPETETETGYLVFGRFYGECLGDGCIKIFKIANGKLYEDTNDNYPGTANPYHGNYRELPNADYDLVKDLVSKIPSELMDETDKRIGQPDAGDWGGLYVEVLENGNKRYWLIDQKKDNLPEYLHGLVDDINEAIAKVD